MGQDLRHPVVREHGELADVLEGVHAAGPDWRPAVRVPQVRRQDLGALVEEALPAVVQRLVAEAREEAGEQAHQAGGGAGRPRHKQGCLAPEVGLEDAPQLPELGRALGDLRDLEAREPAADGVLRGGGQAVGGKGERVALHGRLEAEGEVLVLEARRRPEAEVEAVWFL